MKIRNYTYLENYIYSAHVDAFAYVYVICICMCVRMPVHMRTYMYDA